MGYSLRKADPANTARPRSSTTRRCASSRKHRGALEYSGELYLMTGNLPMAEERLAALDKACFLPCEEYTDLKKAVARYKAAGNKYVARVNVGAVATRCAIAAPTATAPTSQFAMLRSPSGRRYSTLRIVAPEMTDEPDRPCPPLPVDLASRGARAADDDPADMGTAFGLDAITTIQPESPAEIAARRARRASQPHRVPAAPALDLLKRRRRRRRVLTPRGRAAADAPRPRRAARGRANCRRRASSRRRAATR